MTVLLDTHALLWWWENPQQLSATARKIIENHSNAILISAAVAWEVSIKTKTGRVNFESFLAAWPDLLAGEGFSELAILSEHGIRAGQLPLHHKDPFDRILAAQAQACAAPIISIDSIFDVYGVRRIW
jgi:PIN domain nuclease of toxin-antitoxin system